MVDPVCAVRHFTTSAPSVGTSRLIEITQCLLAGLCVLFAVGGPLAAAEKPNVVYVFVDELGYYETGFMGSRTIETPTLDRLASEGMVFTNMLAGSSVCAPTRCCLMTGKHSGHTSVRSNGGGTPLRAGEETIASLLKDVGYATGGFGKWGCGGRDSTGVPEEHGFDVFLGYYDQVHAHSYYPPYLIRNSEEVPLPGNKGMSNGKTYSQYVIHDAALQFIRDHAKQPFFAYLPYTPPHGIFDIPDEDPAWAVYRDKDWPEQAKRYAAMVTMLDRQVGEIETLLKDLGIADNTLLLFSGDNGGNDYFRTPDLPRGFHGANVHPTTGVEFRGTKGTLYEGGLRVPFFAHWPGKIASGTSSDHLGYFPDLLPTLVNLGGGTVPKDVDGISILPTLLGEAVAGASQQQHTSLYWEIGPWRAVRAGRWRAVHPPRGDKWELYDVLEDPAESDNLASQQPDILAKLVTLADASTEPAVEGTFRTTVRHERDRRAKTGRHDDGAPNREIKNRLEHPQLLAADGVQLLSVSSENASNDKYGANAFDRNPNTHWHSRFTPTRDPFPHDLIVDLGRERLVTGIAYLSRQDGSWNGAVAEVEFAVSSDKDMFDSPGVRGNLSRVRSAQFVTGKESRGRFVRIRVLGGHGQDTLSSAAELGILAKD